MVDVQSLTPPEWCNTNPARRTNQAECEAFYVTSTDGLLYACEHDASENKCKMAASGEDCSTSTSICPAVAAGDMLNVRLNGEWCNTDPARSNSQEVCEAAYVLEDGLSFACEHDKVENKCKMAASGEDCST